jgi:ABC-type sugar transport system ATPase subunit
MTYLRLRALHKGYTAHTALHGFDLDVEQGSFVVLLGPSGCGKSTLLQILAGLLPADAGRIELGGTDITDVPPWARDIGLVFQNYALFPHLSIRQNVRFGLDMRGITGREAEARVDEALAMVGLDPGLARRPAELSGGQQQRVAIARAIAIRPRLLLLDEPLSNLDAVLRNKVRLELRELHDRTGITTIMVTHDQSEALATADRIAIMEAGRLLQYDRPEDIYRNPATAFVAGFIGSPPANLLSVTATAPDCWLLPDGNLWHAMADLSPAALAIPAGTTCLMALRPEQLCFGEAGLGCLPARIVAVEFTGGDRLIHVAIGPAQLSLRLPASAPLPKGPEVFLFSSGDAPLLFDPSGGLRLNKPI